MLLIVSLLATLAGACREAGGAKNADDLPPPASTSSSTTLPGTIDAAYAAEVMRQLDHVYGEAVRHLARTRVVDEDFLRYLVAIHNPRIYQLVQDLWMKIQAREFAGLRADPGDPVTRIDKLLRADKDCILIEGDRNLSALHTADDPTNHHRFVALTPLRPDRNPNGLNPTPWTINFSGQAPDGTLPEDACEAQ